MPWKETEAMKERKAFIDEMLKQNQPFRELCREYGISEKTGYKWRKRFLEQGYAGLEEESRAPQKHPNTIDGDAAAGVYPKFCVNSKKQCKTRISQERAGSGAIRCPLDYIIACRTGRVKGGAKRRSSKRPQGAKTLDAVRPVCYSPAFVADRKSAQSGSRSS